MLNKKSIEKINQYNEFFERDKNGFIIGVKDNAPDEVKEFYEKEICLELAIEGENVIIKF